MMLVLIISVIAGFVLAIVWSFPEKFEDILDGFAENIRETPKLRRKIAELYEELEETQKKLDFICGSHDD